VSLVKDDDTVRGQRRGRLEFAEEHTIRKILDLGLT
jgi:hypothetical protein